MIPVCSFKHHTSNYISNGKKDKTNWRQISLEGLEKQEIFPSLQPGKLVPVFLAEPVPQKSIRAVSKISEHLVPNSLSLPADPVGAQPGEFPEHSGSALHPNQHNPTKRLIQHTSLPQKDSIISISIYSYWNGFSFSEI